jgi:ribosomal protein S18 acetylase RimI-like enzyme
MTIEFWRGFEIAEYSGVDLEVTAELFAQVYRETYPGLSPQLLAPRRFKNILLDHTIPNAEVILTAKWQGELAGFMALCPNFIDQIYIRSKFQGKGLGSYWITKAKQKNPDFLELYTLASNRSAISFYLRHGFRVVEQGIAPDEGVPDVRMRCEPLHCRPV